MDLFRRNTPPPSLEPRLKALEETCDILRRETKSLRLEWEELYDKVRHQMSRISRRVSASQQPNGEDLPSSEPTDSFKDLDSVSRSIMIRRARQGVKR